MEHRHRRRSSRFSPTIEACSRAVPSPILQANLAAVERDCRKPEASDMGAATHQHLAAIRLRRHRSRSLRSSGVARLAVLAGSIGLLSGARASATTIDRSFNVQIVRICNDAGTVCAATPYFPAETTKIYAQAGIAPIFKTLINPRFSMARTGSKRSAWLPLAAPALALRCQPPCTPSSPTP